MKIVKRFFLVIGILFLLLLAALIVVPYIFKDKLVEIAKEEINKQVNAEIEFGDFDLSVFKSFPDLCFEINSVKAICGEEFNNDTLLSLGKFSADINILSLFGDVIKVNSLVLDNPAIHARILEDGRANWDIAPASEDTVEVVEEPVEGESSFNLQLNELSIVNGEIVYDDRESNMISDIQGLNFSLKGDMNEEMTDLSILAHMDKLTFGYDGVKYLNKASIDFDAVIKADLTNYKFVFEENLLKVNQLELGFDGWVAMPEEDIDMDMNFEAKKTEFRNILSLIPAVYASDFETVKTSGLLALNGSAKGTYSDETIPGFNLSLLIESGSFKYPDLPGSAKDIGIDLNVTNPDGIDDHTKIDLRKFHVDFDGNVFDAHAFVKNPVSDPDMDVKLKGKIDIDNLKNIVPMEDMSLNGKITADIALKGKLSMIDNEQYEDFDALGKILVEGFDYKDQDLPQGFHITTADMDVAPAFFALNKFDASLGKSDIHMDGRIEDFIAFIFRDELIKGVFNFHSDSFDLNQFMTEEEGAGEQVASNEPEDASESGIIEVPSNIDFVLNASIGKLSYDNMDISDLAGNIVIRDGKVDMNDIELDMLSGTMNLTGSYLGKSGVVPSAKMDIGIMGFDIPSMYKTFNTVEKLAPVAEHCEGKVSIELDMKTDLLPSMEPDYKTLNASGLLQSKSIVIKNSNTFNKIADALKYEKIRNMSLANLTIKFKIENGRVYLEPFPVKFSNSEALISGSQGIDQTLDYVMHMKIPRSEFGAQASQAVSGLLSEAGKKGLEIKASDIMEFDVFVTGTVSDPKISFSLKDQAKDVLNDIKDQVIDKAKEEFDKAKQQAIAKAKAEAAKLMAEADAKGKVIMKEAESRAKQIKDAAAAAAQKVKNEAYANAKKLEDEAKGKPKLIRDAAKASADKLRKEGDDKANGLEREASTSADKALKEAQKKVDDLKKQAKTEGDKLIEKAEKS